MDKFEHDQNCAGNTTDEWGEAMVSPNDSGQSGNQRGGQGGVEDLVAMFRHAKEASGVLKAISHESRLMMLCLLSQGEKSVTELEDLLSLRQPTVSQQLARLRLDGLVETRRQGKVIYYSLSSKKARTLISCVYDLFCNNPDGDDR